MAGTIRPDQLGLELLHVNGALVRRDGSSPAAPAPTANTHTVAAGATTAVFTNTTFDGGTGTTAYTVGDLVKALKTLGLLPA